MKPCIAIGLAKSFRFDALRQRLQESRRGTLYREVLHLENGGDTFIFPFGVMLFWGVPADEQQRLISEITPFADELLRTPFEDHFEYVVDSNRQRIQEDRIALINDTVLDKLALSHGIAQSIKLVELEAIASRAVEETAHIPRNMAETGSTRLSRRDIARMRGRLLLVESDINHHYALLDTPEFFWEYPELESRYREATRYLDVQARVAVLDKKLQMIHKLFDMLADEQKHKHSSLLEWIIIWLIAVEIVIFLGHDLLKIF